MLQELPPPVWDEILGRLAPGDQRFTAPAVARAWREWAEHCLGAAPRRVSRGESPPRWIVQRLWPALSLRQRSNAVMMAVRGGDVGLLRWMWRQPRRPPLLFPNRAQLRACSAAIETGRRPPLCRSALHEWAEEEGLQWFVDACAAAAEGRHLSVLQWTRDRGCPWDGETCGQAAAGGHLAVLQWARSQGCPWDELTCFQAAEGGHLEVLQWARSQACPWGLEVCASAAFHGHLELLQWAHAAGAPFELDWCLSSAQTPEVVDCLRRLAHV